MDAITDVYVTRKDINRSLSDKGITLYSYCKEIENIDSRLRIFKSSKMIDVEKMQKDMFYLYESNPILYDAMQGQQSIEDSLEELGHVNKGIKKILPWRKDKVNNERLEQIGELISKPSYLKTRGIFVPDNVITAGVEIAAFSFGVFYLGTRFLVTPNYDPEQLQNDIHFYHVVLPAITSVLFTFSLGSLLNYERFTKLPIDEAKYLDGKIKELYK